MDVIRYWKDAEYRASVAEIGPDNPAGIIELSDVLAGAFAGGNTEQMGSMGCCGGYTDAYTICYPDCGGASVANCTGGEATCTVCTA